MAYDRTWTLANALKSAVVGFYAAADVELPELQFVSNGVIPYDTELLAVGVNRLYGITVAGGAADGPVSEAIQAERCHAWRAAQFEVVLLRCGPVAGEHPLDQQPDVDPLDIEASARAVFTDAHMMTQALLDAWRAGEFGVGPNMALEEWVAVGEDGGLVGGSMKVRIGLA